MVRRGRFEGTFICERYFYHAAPYRRTDLPADWPMKVLPTQRTAEANDQDL